jgi:hypothetical protein
VSDFLSAWAPASRDRGDKARSFLSHVVPVKQPRAPPLLKENSSCAFPVYSTAQVRTQNRSEKTWNSECEKCRGFRPLVHAILMRRHSLHLHLSQESWQRTAKDASSMAWTEQIDPLRAKL